MRVASLYPFMSPWPPGSAQLPYHSPLVSLPHSLPIWFPLASSAATPDCNRALAAYLGHCITTGVPCGRQGSPKMAAWGFSLLWGRPLQT
jgi:hypothetical protein